MNLAAVWQLPVVFVCENNRYAEASPFAYHSAVERASQRAKGVGIPGVSVDGMDVLAVYTAADEAIERARSGGGPTLIEGRAYRYYGHAEGDAQRYKPCGEEEEYQARDPVETFGRRAVKQGWLTEDDIATIKQEVQAEVDEAWSYGLESPMPDPVEVYEDVYADYELQG
jgi:pyruvate dehydrogenase E1 component alpha subunit